MLVPDSPAALCDAFLAWLPWPVPWGTPEGAQMNCALASAMFAAFCQEQGHPVELWKLEGEWPDLDPEATFVHVVARVRGRVVVDWTARQFDPSAAYPVIEARRDPWPRAWDGRIVDCECHPIP